MPFPIRALETVINQHGLDIEALKSSRLPFAGGAQVGSSGHAKSKDKEAITNLLPTSGTDVPQKNTPVATWQVASTNPAKEETYAGPSQSYIMMKNSIAAPGTGDISIKLPGGISKMDSIGLDVQQSCLFQKASKSSEHESPASMPMEDTRSANSSERHDIAKFDNQTNKKDIKKTVPKRKRANSKVAEDSLPESPQLSDTSAMGHNTRKGKQTDKSGRQGELKAGDQEQPNPLQHNSRLYGGSGTSFISKQDVCQAVTERMTDNMKKSNTFNQISKLPDEREVSSADRIFAMQKGGLLPSRINTFSPNYVWNQNKFALPSENSQGSGSALKEPFPGIHSESMNINIQSKVNTHDEANDSLKSMEVPTNHLHGMPTVNSGALGAFSSFGTTNMAFSAPAPYSSSSFESHDLTSKMHFPRSFENCSSSHLLDKGKDVVPGSGGKEISLSAKPATDSRIWSSAVMREGTSRFPGKAFEVHCLNCICRNNLMPRKLHLEIALGASLPKEADSEFVESYLVSFMLRLSDSVMLVTGGPFGSHFENEVYMNPNLQSLRANQVSPVLGVDSSDMPASPPKYTTSEKWIMDYQKQRLVEEQKWTLKQKKAEERIAACYEKLKEKVSSSEDISGKTKTVIELKKLQLLQLQRRLRRERLEESFKVKRERWKGFNRYVKEFHKRKERIHREKIDRIQREKINLLKNNDVEGYLRMVQDAKSDRVKQLLKETEKYLQKLGSKIRESKSMAKQFEMEMDESREFNIVENNDTTNEDDDGSDQAQVSFGCYI
ncbi:hypothetical protein B296_00008556 [Ensete ventricosum]|uniref:HSA domain-containing protein n=1 Tax=Ensete ventricosum TaxID=4639 RepID=A0A427AZ63_ENSVE|nr:hypothetical protein B296_00008556 [Ensete ventricosum]